LHMNLVRSEQAIEWGMWCAQAYQEIENKYVTENVFSQYMYKTLPSPQSLWVFKRTLCVQMALSGKSPLALRACP
jgi:hypothetical protein